MTSTYGLPLHKAPNSSPAEPSPTTQACNEDRNQLLKGLEREMGLEPTTSSLGSFRADPSLLPLKNCMAVINLSHAPPSVNDWVNSNAATLMKVGTFGNSSVTREGLEKSVRAFRAAVFCAPGHRDRRAWTAWAAA